MRLRKWLILGIVLSFLMMAPALAQRGFAANQRYGVGIQRIDVYKAKSLGQTLDNTKSFVTVICHGTGTLIVFGHLQNTNQAGKPLIVWLGMDGCSPMIVASFTPNVLGNGDFYGIMKCTMTCSNQPSCYSTSCCPGSHNVVVTINTSPAPGATLYITHARAQLKCS